MHALSHPRTASAVVALTLAAGLACAQGGYSLNYLAPPAGASAMYLTVKRISDDGAWAVGQYTQNEPPYATIGVRWPLTGPDAFVAQPLYNPTGWTSISVYSTSADGSIVYGFGRPPGLTSNRAFKWTASGFTQLTPIATPVDCTPDGSLVLLDGGSGSGRIWNTVTDTLVRNTAAGLYPYAMDAAGTNVVGMASTPGGSSAREAAGTGALEHLCTLIGCGNGNDYTYPTTGDISDDGSTWAGIIREPGLGYGGYDCAMFFYRAGVLTVVPPPPQYATCEMNLNAVSADGEVAVGGLNYCAVQAMVYDRVRGMRPLRAELAAAGVDVSAWNVLFQGTDISSNGQTIVGYGQSNFGTPPYDHPFVATIPPIPACDSIDFNLDGLSPDTQDIADFISVFSGGVCAGQAPTDPPCNTDIDFNNDGLLPDVADIDALINVFAGGSCP